MKRLVGRIIFANLLELTLEKYKNFIQAVEESLFLEKLEIKDERLSRGKISDKAKEALSKAVAEIVKIPPKPHFKSPLSQGRVGGIFSIRYTYDGFNKVYFFRDKSFKIGDNSCSAKLKYKLRRISSRNELTHRIIKGIIEHQNRFLSTGDPIDLAPFSRVQLASWINGRQKSEVRNQKTETRQKSKCHSGLVSEPVCHLTSDICNTWISRLVNGLSLITPSGEERVLKSFFPTQRDINKRFIKKFLDKESEDIESGKIKKPLTDNQIKAEAESEYGLKISRHSVGLCRKDMGIPPAKRRLSGYKYPPLSANFSALYPLTAESVQSNAPASSGIYEFRLKGKEIEYPGGKANVIYIGSAKNIKKRLKEHLRVNNRNGHIRDFLKKYECSFRYIQLSAPHFLKEEERRLYRLFVATYGAPPPCNRVSP